MIGICDKLLGRLVLWHGTSRDKADSIFREGFRPLQKGGHHTHRQATWFYHVTSFAIGKTAVDPEKTRTDAVGIILAVDLDPYSRGKDYVHEMDDTAVFLVPLPADQIVARLDLTSVTSPESEVNP